MINLKNMPKLTKSDESFEDMLSGGHPNSLGRTVEVVDIILGDKGALDALFACYDSPDETVRLRTSSAFKRVFRAHPDWFVDYVDRFHDRIPRLGQPSAEWTLSQIHLDCFDVLSSAQIKTATKIAKSQLEESQDWIVLIQTMYLLRHIVTVTPEERPWFVTQLKRLSQDKRTSVSKKARTFYNELSNR